MYFSKSNVSLTVYLLCRKLHFVRQISSSAVVKRSHYEVLGLSPTASSSEIKSAFYKLSKLYHPDKNLGCQKSPKIFQEINEAYQVLGNKSSKLKYDRFFQNKRVEVSFKKNPRSKSCENLYNRKSFSGKYKHYDLEAWYRQHYVETKKMNENSFSRRYGDFDAVKETQQKEQQIRQKEFSFRKMDEFLTLTVVPFIILFALVCMER